jgi:endoglucanase
MPISLPTSATSVAATAEEPPLPISSVRKGRLPGRASLGVSTALIVCGLVLPGGCAKDPPGEDHGPFGPGGPDAGGGDDGQTPVERHGHLKVVGTNLVDEHGDFVQLKGPSSMWLNWDDKGYARDPGGVQFLRTDWHASVIRAAMGIEPSGAFLTDSQKAKDDVRAVIDNAIALGLYVIIDWHDHNAENHLPQAVAFFQEMAQQYGDMPNILYEPFNEPTQIDWNTVLKPYHEAVVAAIRQIDPDNVIILGTSTWSQDVDIAALSPVAGSNLMYTLHFYSCTHGQSFRTRASNARALGAALFVTEWAATDADGGTPAHPGLCLPEAQAWHDWMNERAIGWTAWKLTDGVDASCLFQPGTPATGNWADSQLNGDAFFVRDRMR